MCLGCLILDCDGVPLGNVSSFEVVVETFQHVLIRDAWADAGSQVWLDWALSVIDS